MIANTTDTHRLAAERRSHRRVEVGGDVSLRTEPQLAVQCQDISIGGMSLRADSPTPPAVGSVLDLELELPRAGRLHTRAEVVRTEGALCGLRFSKLDQRSLMALLSYTTRH